MEVRVTAVSPEPFSVATAFQKPFDALPGCLAGLHAA
jgi:hypothetical protein